MSERVRQAAMAKLHERVSRLVGFMNQNAPVSMISAECSLIGELASALDPDGHAQREKEDAAMHAKQTYGVCIEPDCEADAAEDVYCSDHEAEFREFREFRVAFAGAIQGRAS